MGKVPVSAPAEEPVTLAEVKAFMRVDTGEEDAKITSLIVSARRAFEHHTNRALVAQGWRLDLDSFPCGEPICIPHGPVSEVTEITYYDSANDLQTLEAADYQVEGLPLDAPRITPSVMAWSWPPVQPQLGCVKVAYTAGYGAAADVPDDVKFAIMAMVAHWFSQAEGASASQTFAVPLHLEMLLNAHRIPLLA